MIGPLVVAAAVLTVAVGPAPQLLFRIADPRITEASGIAVGIASPSVLYVHNDSGDSARFFAIDARTGSTLATYSVPGATNVDWEDIAVATDARGVPSVWLADIGDNSARRDEVRVYRVDEPTVDPSHPGAQLVTGAPEVWRLRSPDGPADAESLAVARGGASYVFTKSVVGITNAYRVPARPDATRVQSLTSIGTIRFGPTGTAGGPNVDGQLTATGAALSRDGSLLAIRTYTDAYLWSVHGGDVATAITMPPRRIALPEQPQGEGVAVDGDRLLLGSEGVDSAVWAVPIPQLSGASSTRATPAPLPTAPAAGASAAEPGVPRAAVIGLAGGLAALATALAVWWRRRRIHPEAR